LSFIDVAALVGDVLSGDEEEVATSINLAADSECGAAVRAAAGA